LIAFETRPFRIGSEFSNFEWTGCDLKLEIPSKILLATSVCSMDAHWYGTGTHLLVPEAGTGIRHPYHNTPSYRYFTDFDENMLT
jgi:hypothetical protein